MRTKKTRMSVLLAMAALCAGSVQAQVSTAANNSINSATDFVGWDNSVTNDPLQIRHNDGSQPIEFYTTGDAVSEMWLTPTLVGLFQGYPALDVSGNLGVGNGFDMANPPLSLLHLRNNSPSISLGYRDWMRAGVFSSQGLDGMYVGLRSEGTPSENSAVISWGCQQNFSMAC